MHMNTKIIAVLTSLFVLVPSFVEASGLQYTIKGRYVFVNRISRRTLIQSMESNPKMEEVLLVKVLI